MSCTDTSDPNYYLKVVDCQYACPAHTPVPEYIRLISEGRYDDAYMVNRQSNVFPGILGRVCDRPCEPACRRSRVDEAPVAICRLKRAAADLKGDISARLPAIPKVKNGKSVALIGGGPASLTVANDLMPLGYRVDLYDEDKQAGGAVRRQVPHFRLPESVLNEEVDTILNFGVTTHFNHKVTSLKELLDKGYDTVFIGTGAPVGRDLILPGRDQAGSAVQVGLNFLAAVSFGHLKSLSGKVLVIGGGNTAMDCCRTALRLGASQVTVVAPEGFHQMLASEWEVHDAQEEGVTILNGLLPLEYRLEGDTLTGMAFTPLSSCYDEQKRFNPVPSGEETRYLEADHIILAIGQSVAFPFVDAELGLERLSGSTQALKVHVKTLASSHPQVFVGGDAAFGPKNIIQAVADGHKAALSMHLRMQGLDLEKDRPGLQLSLESQKMAMNQWSYTNAYDPVSRRLVPTVALEKRLADATTEVEIGFDAQLAAKEAARCLNCDVQTVFQASTCIECDACVDICPVSCLSMSAHAPEGDVFESLPLKLTGRFMIKDENHCLHCGLCAERCPVGSWDMQKSVVKIPRC